MHPSRYLILLHTRLLAQCRLVYTRVASNRTHSRVACRRAEFPDRLVDPAETREISHPLPVLLLKKFYGERFRPSFECCGAGWILEHGLVGLEDHSVVGNVAPFVVHVNVQLGSLGKFKTEMDC